MRKNRKTFRIVDLGTGNAFDPFSTLQQASKVMGVSVAKLYRHYAGFAKKLRYKVEFLTPDRDE